MTRGRARGGGTLALLALAFLAGAGDAAGQTPPASNPIDRAMREAAMLEANGDVAGAERLLREVATRTPAPAGAVLALERVLSRQGRGIEILPVIERFLASDPASADVRALELRVLSEVDSVAALERESEAWLSAAGDDPRAWAEVARVYEAELGAARALDILRRGREATGDDRDLVLATGDLRARSGDADGAVEAWLRAVGDDASGASTLVRRLGGLEDPTRVRDALDRLSASDVFARRRAAAAVALEMGLEEEALVRSAAVAEELGERARASFLQEVGARANSLGMNRVATWAWQRRGDDARTPAERRPFDERLVASALAAGDTVTAAAAQRRVADTYAAGGEERRRSLARALRLELAGTSPAALGALLDSFEREFPDAPELDDLAARAAGVLQAGGDRAGAGELLERVAGPRTAAERAYLELAAGRIEEARAALLEAAGALAPTEATEAIQLAALLGRLSPAAARALGAAAAEARTGSAAEAVALVEAALEEAAPGERAPLLAEAARMADRAGEHAGAARVRERLLAEHADDPAAADGLLSLARYHAGRPDGRARAIDILEDLIAARPDGAIVPRARAELARIRGTP